MDDQIHHERLLAASHAAVMQFGAARAGALARTTIWHLRRLPASGIWGDDYAYRTLWDEVCDEVQEGPFDMPESDCLPSLSTAFEMTIRPFVDMLLEKLSRQEAALLTLYAIDDLDEAEKAKLAGFVEVVREGLRLVEQRAAQDAARLASLCEAVEVGWRDLEAGRYRHVSESDVADYVAQLGALARQRARS